MPRSGACSTSPSRGRDGRSTCSPTAGPRPRSPANLSMADTTSRYSVVSSMHHGWWFAGRKHLHGCLNFCASTRLVRVRSAGADCRSSSTAHTDAATAKARPAPIAVAGWTSKWADGRANGRIVETFGNLVRGTTRFEECRIHSTALTTLTPSPCVANIGTRRHRDAACMHATSLDFAGHWSFIHGRFSRVSLAPVGRVRSDKRTSRVGGQASRSEGGCRSSQRELIPSLTIQQAPCLFLVRASPLLEVKSNV